MGLKFRKRVKICKGLSLNLNKDSVGVSIGTKGAHYTINSKGRKTASIGIPGTGLYYTESTVGSKKQIKSKKRPYSALKVLLAFMTLRYFNIICWFKRKIKIG